MVTAWARTYAEKTQANSEKPPRSRTMAGMAVATIVESIAARLIASRSPTITRSRLTEIAAASSELKCGGWLDQISW